MVINSKLGDSSGGSVYTYNYRLLPSSNTYSSTSCKGAVACNVTGHTGGQTNVEIKFKIKNLVDNDNIFISFNNLATYASSFNPNYSQPTTIGASGNIGGLFIPAFTLVADSTLQDKNDVILQIVATNSSEDGIADLRYLAITVHKYAICYQYLIGTKSGYLYTGDTVNTITLNSSNQIVINGHTVNDLVTTCKYNQTMVNRNSLKNYFVYVDSANTCKIQDFTTSGTTIELYDYSSGTAYPNTTNPSFWGGDTNGWCGTYGAYDSIGSGFPAASQTAGYNLHSTTAFTTAQESPSTSIALTNLSTATLYPCIGYSSTGSGYIEVISL